MPGPNMKQPCKGCGDRTTGEQAGDCHKTCEAYLAYQKEMKEKRNFLFRENTGRYSSPTVKYKKSGNCWVAPKGITHKKAR